MALRVLRGGSLQGSAGSTSPHSENVSIRRILGAVTFQASADYLAGQPKLVTPGNTTDPRAAMIRNPNAPQAAENDYRSNTVNYSGYYRFFFGPSDQIPTTSEMVRALSSQPLTNSGSVQILNTGNTQNVFSFVAPPGWAIASVSDLTVSGADLTNNYVGTTMSVKDAAGNPVSGYTRYTMNPAAAYNNNHQHQITLRQGSL